MYDDLYAPPYSLGTVPTYMPATGMDDASVLMQTLAPPLFQMLTGQRLDMSLFRPGNPYNNWRQLQFQREHQQLMMGGAPYQADAFYNMAAGAMGMAGVTMTPQLHNNLRAMTTGASSLLATSGLAPRFMNELDMLAGGRNPMVLSHYMHIAGQGLIDPGTGGVGLSAVSSARLTNDVFRHFYGSADDVRRPGLSTARMGELLGEMAGRGDLQGGGKDSDALSRNVIQALEKRTKLITTMSEIFGAAGRPNAPIQELYNALEQFAGGASNWNPERLNQQLRSVIAGGPASGLSFATMQRLVQANVSDLSAVGILNPGPFAALSATSAAEMRTALNQIGYNPSGWNRMNLDQQTLLNQRMTNLATGSTQANFLASLMRMRDVYGVNAGAGGDTISRIAMEVQSGSLSSDTINLLYSNRATREGLLASGIRGMDANRAAFELRFMQAANQETMHRYDIGGLIQRDSQGREMRDQFFSGGLALSRTMANMQSLGVRSPALARRVASYTADALFGGALSQEQAAGLMSGGEAGNEARGILARNFRDRLLQDAASGGQLGASATRLLDAINASADPEAFINTMIQQQMGGAQENLRRNKWGGSWYDVVQPFTPEVRAQRQAVAMRNRLVGNIMGAAMSGEHMSLINTMLARMSDPAATGSPLDRIKGMLGEGVKEGLYADLSGRLESLGSAQSELDKKIAAESKRLREGGVSEGSAEWNKAMAGLQEEARKVSREYKEIERLIDSDPELRTRVNRLGDSPEQAVQKILIEVLKLNVNGQEFNVQNSEAQGGRASGATSS